MIWWLALVVVAVIAMIVAVDIGGDDGWRR